MFLIFKTSKHQSSLPSTFAQYPEQLLARFQTEYFHTALERCSVGAQIQAGLAQGQRVSHVGVEDPIA